ncbi:AAA family ATPase [Noviherbaspirillum pedocola]|uniref:AAA family ATPase n=1 Tax=Noviherbaspirillum pedocola TaxID=2801341 RepID=A0A934W5Q6_9BURK|nr:ATP-binding protein [Noviherbaspirillum pedocola]MBK4735237.1 AAA family ATPase [Noviherbaspirillum pedocola]
MTTNSLALSPALCDPATIRTLLAIYRLCRDQPGSLYEHHLDDIGFVIHPLAVLVRQRLEGDEAARPEWAVRLDAASAVGGTAYYEWLGRNLSWPEPQTAPLYERMYAELLFFEARDPFPMQSNVRHLQESFALTEAETRILLLAACLDHSVFAFRYLRLERPVSKVHRAIAAAIDMPLEPVIAALKESGALMQSGLFENLADGTTALRDLLELSRFGQRVFTLPHARRADLFDALLEPLPAPADAQALQWPALAAQQRTVQAVLETALAHAEAGVNILLYGPPGTGKTEFAKQLALSIGCRAYEVACRDGAEASRGQRLCSLRTAQSLLGNAQSALLVLDEAEDVFLDQGQSGAAAPRIGSKAWMNRLLETNPHPVIWITNSIAEIDQAYRRRFTFCIRFDVPELAVRRQIAQRHLQPLGVSEATIDRIARRSGLSPALIASSAKVAHLAAGKAGTHEEVALCYLDSQGEMMRARAMRRTPHIVTRFDTAYLQIGGRFTPEQIIDAIARHGRGTALMSGPPGTGKTQLASRIAERLERELLYYSASDVNSKWFGESEQQVAEMFTSCDPERQMVFLDEAETLLSDRASAMHRASEAVTAEFLRQLESFDGVFLCATNHGRSIDSALMRRFVFRLEFKPLSCAQREQMLRELIDWPVQQELPRSAMRELESLEGLTPGDFANVKKRFALLGLQAELDAWLIELRQEWEAKPDDAQGRAIGFV